MLTTNLRPLFIIGHPCVFSIRSPHPYTPPTEGNFRMLTTDHRSPH
ncbi:MAG: hypothetical protein LBP62_07690 [Clostridiales bacterium]|nr:hypothetical protein [Clostridiales bacterium]